MKNSTNNANYETNRIKINNFWICDYFTDDGIKLGIFKRTDIYGYPFSKEDYSYTEIIERKPALYYTECEGDTVLINIINTNPYSDHSYSMNSGDILLEIKSWDKWNRYECTNFLFNVKHISELISEINKNLSSKEKIEISKWDYTISFEQYKQLNEYIKLMNQNANKKVLKCN